MTKKTLSLGAQLGLLITLILAILGVEIIILMSSLKGTTDAFVSLLNNEVTAIIKVKDFNSTMLKLRKYEKDYLLTSDMNYGELWEETAVELHSIREELYAFADNSELDQIFVYIDDYRNAIQELASATEYKGLDDGSGVRGQLNEELSELQGFLPDNAEINQQILRLQLGVSEYLRTTEDKTDSINEVVNHIEGFKSIIQHGDFSSETIISANNLLDEFRAAFMVLVEADNTILAAEQQIQDATAAAEPLNLALSEELTQIATEQMNEIASASTQRVTMLLISAIVTFIISIIASIFLIRAITRNLLKIADNINSAAMELNVAASQMNQTSQVLSQGATEQAAGIEETSSSLEELTAMVNQNTNNAVTLNQLAVKSSEQAVSGKANVEEMLQSMEELNASTDKIKNIIQLIENIAFQTNILALNAAVEAARAGEAGLGFAVVADEVKTLANKSTESAKDTAALIEQSIAGINLNLARTQKIDELIGAFGSHGEKVLEMSREVEASSHQQNEGFEQINQAIIQLDMVTQTNAASAEESASTADELASQAASLRKSVNQFMMALGQKQSELKDTNPNMLQLENRKGKSKFEEDEVIDLKMHGSQKAKDTIPFEEDEKAQLEDFSDF